MIHRAFLTLGIGIAPLASHAQSTDPAVTVFGVTKNAYYQQTNAASLNYSMSGIYAFIEGTGISSAYPSQPVTLTAPNGATYTLETSNAFSEPSLRFDQFETGFANQASLDALFPDGNYTFESGGQGYRLQLAGSYASAPMVEFSSGRWEDGKLLLTPEEAASDWRITSSFTNANGFRSIAINDAAFSFDYFTYVIGPFPGTVSALIAGNSLKPGTTYHIEVDFDNTVDFITPTAGELRNGFALYSTTTFLSVTVVPEPETYVLVLAGLGLVGIAARRKLAK